MTLKIILLTASSILLTLGPVLHAKEEGSSGVVVQYDPMNAIIVLDRQNGNTLVRRWTPAGHSSVNINDAAVIAVRMIGDKTYVLTTSGIAILEQFRNESLRWLWRKDVIALSHSFNASESLLAGSVAEVREEGLHHVVFIIDLVSGKTVVTRQTEGMVTGLAFVAESLFYSDESGVHVLRRVGNAAEVQPINTFKDALVRGSLDGKPLFVVRDHQVWLGDKMIWEAPVPILTTVAGGQNCIVALTDGQVKRVSPAGLVTVVGVVQSERVSSVTVGANEQSCWIALGTDQVLSIGGMLGGTDRKGKTDAP